MFSSFPATSRIRSTAMVQVNAGQLFAMRRLGRLWSLNFLLKWQAGHCEDGSGDENENVASERVSWLVVGFNPSEKY